MRDSLEKCQPKISIIAAGSQKTDINNIAQYSLYHRVQPV
jgi:hypothetical protein